MSYRWPLGFAAILAFALPVFPQQAQKELGQLDSSPVLFTVMAAINASGYDADINSPSNHWLRKIIRDEIASKKPPVVNQIREFMRKHRQEDAVAELRQYISYALLVDGPPKYEFRIQDQFLPPDISAMRELSPLLAQFYQQAGIADLWQRSQPAIEELISKYQQPARKSIMDVSAYLRVPPGQGYVIGRKFQVLLDVMAPPNQIHLRSFLDDYYLVITNSAEPQADHIRSAYLHFVLDPLATKYYAEIEKKRGIGDYAKGAPYLSDYYKDDFLLLTTKCLEKAIESRLLPGASQQQAAVKEAMSQGYVLTAHFAEQLPAYEKQETAMRLYFPELISSIDLKKEERRLEKLEFSQVRPERIVKPVVIAPPEQSPAEKKLVLADEAYRRRDLDTARGTFAEVLSLTQDKPVQGTAYYGLARIALLRNDPDLAVKLFEQALALGPPAEDRAWALVYLGRLSVAAGEPQDAEKRYREALAVDGISPGAKQAAEQELQKLAPKGN